MSVQYVLCTKVQFRTSALARRSTLSYYFLLGTVNKSWYILVHTCFLKGKMSSSQLTNVRIINSCWKAVFASSSLAIGQVLTGSHGSFSNLLKRRHFAFYSMIYWYSLAGPRLVTNKRVCQQIAGSRWFMYGIEWFFNQVAGLPVSYKLYCMQSATTVVFAWSWNFIQKTVRKEI